MSEPTTTYGKAVDYVIDSRGLKDTDFDSLRDLIRIQEACLGVPQFSEPPEDRDTVLLTQEAHTKYIALVDELGETQFKPNSTIVN